MTRSVPVVDGEGVQVDLTERSLLAALLVADALLLVLHLVSQWLRFYGQDAFGRSFEATELLNLDAEVSLPTWWQQLTLAVAALLAFVIARAPDGSPTSDRPYWVGLGTIFLLVSIDEGTEVHERLIAPMRSTFDITGGPFWFAWLIPGLGLFVVFALVYVRFWFRLPAPVRFRLGLAGVLYLTGAVGFEMIGGIYESSRGIQDFGYSLVIACEEGFELLGQTVLVVALVVELARRTSGNGVRFRIDDRPASATGASSQRD